MAGAGADQMYQRMFKGIVIRQEQFILLLFFRPYMALVRSGHFVQEGFFFFDLLYKGNHGVIICSNNMAQGHFMYLHGGLAELCKLALAVHIIIRNGSRAFVHITDIQDGKDI